MLILEAKKDKPGNHDNRGETSTQSSSSPTKDIVVFGLSYDTTDDELKEYFTTSCGELDYHEVELFFVLMCNILYNIFQLMKFSSGTKCMVG